MVLLFLSSQIAAANPPLTAMGENNARLERKKNKTLYLFCFAD